MVCFRLAIFDVYCVVVYRPPSNSPEMNACLLELISDLSIGKEVIIAGNFNLPSVDWSTNPPKASSPTDRDFLDACNALGLSQWVQESTYPRSGNILDLILTSETDRIGLSSVLPPLPSCDHCPTEFQYVFADRQSSSSSQPYISQHPKRSWHKGKYRAISEHPASIDWDLELYCLNADACYKHLTTILHRLIDEHVPVKPPPSTNNPRWLKRVKTSIQPFEP